MTDRRLAQTRQTTSEYGILSGPLQLARVPASPAVASLVERHWLVSWDLPPGERNPVTLLPHPCVNLVYDRGTVAIAGVGTERFTYPQEGRGQVFGVKFRPGAFHPFLRGSVATLTDQTVPLRTLWGPDADRLAADLARAADLPAMVTVAERHLRARWPPRDPEVDTIGEITHALLHDRTITRVDQVCARFGITPRTLQRLFQRYVGVPPKWVLSRYRLHEAAARLAEGTARTWAEVAADLGYFDQPHFIRDFTRAVGMPPAAYAEACRRNEPVPVGT
jgi:AraC-like DNA-binding protein